MPNLKSDKDLKLGDYDWFFDNASVSIVKWRDKRIVSLLSNFHDPQDTSEVPRKSKDGSDSRSHVLKFSVNIIYI